MDVVLLIIFLIIYAIRQRIEKKRKDKPAYPSSSYYESLQEKQERWAAETWNRWNSSEHSSPWYEKKYILTDREKKEYWKLFRVAREFQLYVFPKVGFIDLLKPTRESYMRYVWAKHIDFAIWSPRTMNVVCLIELMDSTHNTKTRIDQDKFKRAALEEAGYIYYELYEFEESRLRVIIKSALTGKPAKPFVESEQAKIGEPKNDIVV